MSFFRQYEKGSGNWGTYLLTLSTSLLAYFIGSIFAYGWATSSGIDLLNPSDYNDKSVVLTFMLIPFVFLLVTLVLCVKYLHRRPILSVFTSRESFDWKRFFLAFFIWGGIQAVFLGVQMAMGAPVSWNINWSAFFPLLLVSIFVLPLQTAAEDVLFRGYLFQSLGYLFKHGGLSILISGILFGLLHAGNPEVATLGKQVLVYYILSGIFLGILTHMDDGMELGMGYHAMNNFFAAVILTNDWQAFQTDALLIDHSPPSFGWEIILLLVIIQPALLFIFARIYRWTGWKEKLLK